MKCRVGQIQVGRCMVIIIYIDLDNWNKVGHGLEN